MDEAKPELLLLDQYCSVFHLSAGLMVSRGGETPRWREGGEGRGGGRGEQSGPCVLGFQPESVLSRKQSPPFILSGADAENRTCVAGGGGGGAAAAVATRNKEKGGLSSLSLNF